MSEAGDFVTLMIACRRRFESNFESLSEEDGLSVMQALVIRTIARFPEGISMIGISKEIGVSRSLITGVMHKLEETGVVLITPVDHRTTSVTLTDKGEVLLPGIECRIGESYSRVIGSLSDDERRILTDALQHIGTENRTVRSGAREARSSREEGQRSGQEMTPIDEEERPAAFRRRENA